MSLEAILIHSKTSDILWGSEKNENLLVFTDLRDQPDSALPYHTDKGWTSKMREWLRLDVWIHTVVDSIPTEVAVSVNGLAKILNTPKAILFDKANQGNLEEYIKDSISLERIWPNNKTLDEAKSTFGPLLSEKMLKRIVSAARNALYFSEEDSVYRESSEANPLPFIATKIPGKINPKIALVANTILAEGSFGEVRKAVDSEEGSCVVKFAKPGAKGSKESLQNECKILQEIHKDKIVEGVQLPPFQIVENALLEPEYPGGKTLIEEPLTPLLAKKLTQGLAHLHELDISHGDIKPGNVFVRDDRCDLGDFGGARPFTKIKKSFDKQGFMELLGICTEFYLCALDIDILNEALTCKDWETCKQVMKARDVYALGYTLYLCNQKLITSCLSKKQERTIKLMIHPVYTMRPTAEEVAKVFA